MPEGNFEGYNLVQVNRVSSSSDNNSHVPFSFPSRIKGRPTYRSLRINLLDRINNPNPMPVPPPLPSTSAKQLSTSKSFMWLTIIFGVSLTTLFLVYANFPNLSEEEKIHMKLPLNLEDAKQLGLVLNRYKNDNYLPVLIGVITVYIFLQTFAIPGSLFLSILSGYLFPFHLALFLVCTCSAIGASLCFLVSQVVGKRLVSRWFPNRVNKLTVIVNNHRDNLLNIILFLRLTPFIPNWFINLAAPVVGVPLKPFVLGTFVGVAPQSFVAIQTGQTLHSATDTGISWASMLLLSSFAILSIIPTLLKHRFKAKLE